MKTSEFQGLIEQLETMTPEQRAILTAVFSGVEDEAEIMAVITARFADKPCCPHCQSDAQKWGWAAGLQRYRCCACKVTFNALTGTPLANLKLRRKLAAYGQAMLEGLSLRKAAKCCGINLSTAFDWRR